VKVTRWESSQGIITTTYQYNNNNKNNNNRFLDEVDPHKNWKKLLERNVNDEGEVFFACSMCSINMKK
jgi:hypothetical protein